MTPQQNDALDERGTTPAQARTMIEKLRDNAFDGSDEKLAVALGRTQQEISDILQSETGLDDDLIMKVRGIAQQRNVNIE
jgi:plasmid maintenance system antidote protein VapI